jgi:hypothetical protein
MLCVSTFKSSGMMKYDKFFRGFLVAKGGGKCKLGIRHPYDTCMMSDMSTNAHYQLSISLAIIPLKNVF